MALTDIQKVRLTIGDTDPSLPICADTEYEYFLEKNSNSIRRAAIDAAKTILFKLSINASDQTVDIFTIKGKASATAYKEALQMYLRNPEANGLLDSLRGYAGGISIADMQANSANTDNNIVRLSSEAPASFPDTYLEDLNI